MIVPNPITESQQENPDQKLRSPSPAVVRQAGKKSHCGLNRIFPRIYGRFLVFCQSQVVLPLLEMVKIFNRRNRVDKLR